MPMQIPERDDDMRWGEWIDLEELRNCPFCMATMLKGERALKWGERYYCSETCKKEHQLELRAEELTDK